MTDEKPTKPNISDVTTYVEAVQAFIDAADWLTDVDLPGLMTLKTLAKHLDAVAEGNLPQAALVSQFNMSFRDLRSRAPKEKGGGKDPLAEAMGAASLNNQNLWESAFGDSPK